MFRNARSWSKNGMKTWVYHLKSLGVQVFTETQGFKEWEKLFEEPIRHLDKKCELKS